MTIAKRHLRKIIRRCCFGVSEIDNRDIEQNRVVLLMLAPFLLACFAMVSVPQAQGETIPEAIARGALGRTSTEHSGKSPSVAEVLRNADLVVRGIVGESRSYLSSDERNVYTDYLLVSPVVLYERRPRTAEKPGPMAISITQLGGKAMVGNVEFTQTELGLPPLKPGTEGIFILEEREGSITSRAHSMERFASPAIW